ncbi:MAG: hypothetical protein HFI03_14020 [Lachnospiraceae bacterium]|jgi:hypothetical protein|nr:hypothetical protein [Lachnospiraceae bacterium]
MVDTFKNLTDEKMERIIRLPYELLARQLGKEYGMDIKVDVQIKKKEGIGIS